VKKRREALGDHVFGDLFLDQWEILSAEGLLVLFLLWKGDRVDL